MLYAKDIVTDWTKVGTMMMISRWLSGESLADRSWQMASLYTLVGFSTYHLSTRQIINTDLAGEYKPIADDFVKVGTMMIVSRLLSGGNFTDSTWIYACLATLIGFAVYHLTTAKYIQGKELTYNSKLQDTIDDWAKNGTMFGISRLIKCQSILDPAWAGGTVATLLGFTTYDLVTSRLVDLLPF